MQLVSKASIRVHKYRLPAQGSHDALIWGPPAHGARTWATSESGVATPGPLSTVTAPGPLSTVTTPGPPARVSDTGETRMHEGTRGREAHGTRGREAHGTRGREAHGSREARRGTAWHPWNRKHTASTVPAYAGVHPGSLWSTQGAPRVHRKHANRPTGLWLSCSCGPGEQDPWGPHCCNQRDPGALDCACRTPRS